MASISTSSRSIGKILRIFLYVVISLSLISLVSSFIYTYQLNFYIQHIMWFDQFTTYLLYGVNLILFVLYLIWVYKVHVDLAKCELNYPITPFGALRRIVIPFYNIWGLWNIYSTMAEQLKKRNHTYYLGKQISTYLPLTYILFFVSRILVKYLNKGTLAGETNLGTIFIISNSVDISLFLIYLLMVNSVNMAIANLANMESIKQTEESESIA